MAIFCYIGALIVEAITRGVVTGAIAERRRRRTIEQLRDHYIICGYGRVGRVEEARENNLLYVEGNGTEDEDLDAAGLSRARGLVASSDSDADNLVLKPQVAAFLDVASATGGPDLRFEEIEVVEGST